MEAALCSMPTQPGPEENKTRLTLPYNAEMLQVLYPSQVLLPVGQTWKTNKGRRPNQKNHLSWVVFMQRRSTLYTSHAEFLSTWSSDLISAVWPKVCHNRDSFVFLSSHDFLLNSLSLWVKESFKYGRIFWLTWTMTPLNYPFFLDAQRF